MRTVIYSLLSAVAPLMICGCGDATTGGPSEEQSRELRRFALAYHEVNAKGALPSGLEELKSVSSGFPNLFKRIEAGDFVIIWRAVLDPNGDENDRHVLGYEKVVPEKGGVVLMGGGLVRTMTPEEFRQAPKIKTK